MPEDISDPSAAPESLVQGRELIVVGVGASAGGLEALTELIRYLPPDQGMAFVLVQHLDPHHVSALPELLAGKTEMPVLQVHGDTPIEPNHVYVIAPKTLMLVRGKSLVLEARPEGADKFRPIDSLFESMAEEFRSRAVGIVLSGAATDGTWGLKNIKKNGGITFAQDDTAKFESMPHSAIAAGVVDYILPPRRIAEELSLLAPSRHLRLGETDWLSSGNSLQKLILTLRHQTGVDFSQYKQPTILRRLQRRMVMARTEDLKQYLALVQKEPNEAKALFDDLLINVTDFFRDPEVFEAAKQAAYPLVIKNSPPSRTIRVWVPGCSSGEEVYSLVITLMEFLETGGLDCTLQVFGTDISDLAIAKARAGVYGEGSVQSIAPERLRRFFVRTEQGYQVNRTIREMCIFSRHNLGSDPPLSRIDLVSCRNLLIYFSPQLQNRIGNTFAYALRPNGCLILGKSESIAALTDYFTTLDDQNRIYSRNMNVPHLVLDLPGQPHGFAMADFALHADPAMDARADRRSEAGSSANGSSVGSFVTMTGVSSFVVNEDSQVLEFHGTVAKYLAEPNPRPGVDLARAVREDLRDTVSTTLQRARETSAAVISELPHKGGSNGPAGTKLTVVPLGTAGPSRRFLILFDGSVEEGGTQSRVLPPDSGRDSQPKDSAQLEEELKSVREYLQSVIEELRSSNEEAQSANEELQSTNEEMQTSKEELQSSNEELNTINAEMQSRNAELARLNDDLTNLLGSMNVPIVMTGSDLRIRRFTPIAEKVLRLISTDVGRPITDLKPRINIANLEAVLQHVLDTLEPFEQEVQDQDGRMYLMRVRPYRTSDNRIDGTVLQLHDVSAMKRSLEDAKHARDYAEAIVNTVREPLVVLDSSFKIQNANRAFFESLAETPGSAIGRSIYDVAKGQFDSPGVRQLFGQLTGPSALLKDVEIEYPTPKGEVRILLLNARRLTSPEQNELILLAFEDITERKRAAEVRYRRLFETAWDGILLIDSDSGEILDLNPYTERLLGYAREELVGRRIWSVEPMQLAPAIRASLEQAKDQGVLRLDALTLRTKGGQELQAEVIASVYMEGDRHAIQLNIRDVTERKKFERKLQETQKLEGLGLLAGGIAHDFNNILTGILGNASLAYSKLPTDHHLRVYLREIVQASERAAFLTRQMLAYAGRGRFIIETIDLSDLVREISSLIRTSIPKRVELKLDLQPGLPSIEADPAQIQQVVMNLVINGAEAIGENVTGKVEISTRLREIRPSEVEDLLGPDVMDGGAYVQLDVRDTGSGMDEDTKARIFDPFFTTKFTGRGLGLAAVQGIIKRHSGVLRVYSTLGHGTTFTTLFPAQKKKVSTVLRTKPSLASIPSGSFALIVDDEEVIRNLAHSVLSAAGMRVLVANNGKEGVELFRQHHRHFSIVVLDLMMPILGGEEAFAQMTEINPSVPIILSSGFDESEAARKFAALKPAKFLQKPYSSDRLIELVAETVIRDTR